MTPSKLALIVLSSTLFAVAAPLFSQEFDSTFARDPGQPIDQQYTDQMRKYTTDPSFTSPLVDYLPASKTLPTPAKVLGDISGAPDMLPYAEDVYKYFRLLEASSPRVKVFTIGHSEEGREMIAAAIADPKLLAGAKENDARLAQLADPRKLGPEDAKAREIRARLSSGRGRCAVYQVHPLARDRADNPSGGSRWALPNGRHL